MRMFSTSIKHKIVRSQFIEDYLNKKISWNDYLSIIESWEISITKWNILPYPKKSIDEDSIDKEVLAYVRKTIPIFDNNRYLERYKRDSNYVHKFREKLQIDHDAYCLSLISKERELEYKKGKKPLGPWFVTYDRLVSIVDAAYKKSKDFGFIIHPRSLFNYLLVYSKVDFKQEDEFLVTEAIIKYTASTAESKLNISEYSRIITNKLGLEEENVEIVKRVLLASPLRGELNTALRLNRGDKAEEIVFRIFSDESVISTIINEEKASEKLKRVRKKLIQEQEEAKKYKAQLKELEKMMKEDKKIKISAEIKIDIKTQNEINNLVNLLQSNDAFDNGIINNPPKDINNKSIFDWLNKIKETIETSEKISTGIKSLLPFITYLIGKIGTV